VEKISGNPDRARQAAYLKAMDDLLTRGGPVVVSKTVQDQTTVVDVKRANRVLESTFKLRASRLLQPGFERNGIDHGYAWVLLATTEDDIERGWQEFVAWRAERMEQAQKLFEQAKGPERVQLLKASLSLLEDAGAVEDPGMLYYQVKAALDVETARTAQLDKFQKDFRIFVANGQLAAAEATLEEAQRSGLQPATYEKCAAELSQRRAEAMQHIQAGDDLLREEHYKEARVRYEQARKIDRDNSLIAGKIEMADRFERESRGRNVRATVGFVAPIAVQTIGEYLEFKREQEQRKREEEERKREEAERAAEEERNRQRQQPPPPPNRPPRRPPRNPQPPSQQQQPQPAPQQQSQEQSQPAPQQPQTQHQPQEQRQPVQQSVEP
jgi:tetratricopeptide (TPR) repeat protein